MPQDHHQGLNITGGIWRGLRLKLPAKLPHTLRPTPEAVRETLFDWLSAWEGLSGARVLDLFAGSGALSLEALSRGAHCAVMVEADPGACAALQRTLERLNTRAQILNRTAQDYLGQSTDTFDLVFLDPPYEGDALERAIAHIARFDILAPRGIIVAECPADKVLPALSAPYHIHREYRYGKIKATVYHRDGEDGAEA